MMKINHYTDIEAKDAGEGTSKLTIRWLITKDMGAERFAMRLFEMQPNGHSPLHNHPWEHEIFILEGEGVAFDGTKEKKVKAGDAILISSSEKHQLRNNSRKMLRFICLIPYIET